MEVKPDPADGLPAIDAGTWVHEKHKLLSEYIKRSGDTRRGWLDPEVAARRGFVGDPAGAAYIELFSGPGRIFIRDTDDFHDGSPLVAYEESVRSGSTFTSMHLADEREDFCAAARARLGRRGANVISYPVEATRAASQVVDALNPHGLNFAFLDPFGFEGLPFTIIQTLARLKRIDVMIYVSAMGLQRMLEDWMGSTRDCPLDGFAPDWRKVAKGRRPDDIVTRGLIFEHWLSLIRKAGFEEAKGKPPLIRGSRRQPLYWLVLVAKHELARKFWNIVSRDEKQDDLFNNN